MILYFTGKSRYTRRLLLHRGVDPMPASSPMGAPFRRRFLLVLEDGRQFVEEAFARDPTPFAKITVALVLPLGLFLAEAFHLGVLLGEDGWGMMRLDDGFRGAELLTGEEPNHTVANGAGQHGLVPKPMGVNVKVRGHVYCERAG